MDRMGLFQWGCRDGLQGKVIMDIFEWMVPEDQEEYIEGYRIGLRQFFDEAKAYKNKIRFFREVKENA